jgi:serine/threonine protein phosphatase 1
MYVHGHTALDFPQHHGNRINIDGGAGYGRPLVPTLFDGAGWFTLDDNGRTPLHP